MSAVRTETRGAVRVVTIARPAVRNAVDRATADALVEAFEAFDRDESVSVAVLTGEGGTFCAGADLKAIARDAQRNRVELDGDGPMGPTRMALGKPVIAAIEGHAVAGGLELALWCDLRVASREAVFGVFCRRFGVPLIDGGTIRLPRVVGMGRAMDMILSGRAVPADEALAMGLCNRVTEPGGALDAAVAWGEALAALPQRCMRSDRLSAIEQWAMPMGDALRNETARGLSVLRSGESAQGASRFIAGAGRHGDATGSRDPKE